MSAEAALHVVSPIPRVLFVTGDPVHDSLAVALVVFPISFVVVACLVSHLSSSLFHAFRPVSFINTPILVPQLSVTVAHSVYPRTLVLYTLLLIDVNALTLSQTIDNLAFVS